MALADIPHDTRLLAGLRLAHVRLLVRPGQDRDLRRRIGEARPAEEILEHALVRHARQDVIQIQAQRRRGLGGGVRRVEAAHDAVMQVGLERDLWHALLHAEIRLLDEGPFAALAGDTGGVPVGRKHVVVVFVVNPSSLFFASTTRGVAR